MRNKSGIKRKEIKRKTLKSKKRTLKKKLKILRNKIKKNLRNKVVSLVLVNVR
jgi:chaperonin cofactor prefoldin